MSRRNPPQALADVSVYVDTGSAAPLAPEPPAAQEPDHEALTAAFCSTYSDLLEAHNLLANAKERHARAVDAKARALGKGALVTIAGVTFESTPPRKPKGGDVDPGALWTLVERKVAR